MRRTFATRRRVLCAALVALVCLLPAPAQAAWNAAGKWLVEGVGFAEKSVLRVSLQLEGQANLYTVASGDIWCLTSYDMDLNLTASSLGVNAWKQHNEETFTDRIPLPAINPTANEPFKLPAVTQDGLTYQVTFTSATSGTVSITGTTDMGSAGSVKVGSNSVIWKEGTAKPALDKSQDSGCRAGTWGAAIFLLLPFLFLGFRVKY